MTPADRAAWADYLERNKAARDQYRAMPIVTRTNSPEHRARHDCTRCGDTTRAASGLCLTCRQKDRP